ncbi:hypothetical protein [Paludibacterium denitrificans]|nr:hypothetical protein [Paludibacterium denitrificans]
MTAHGYAPLWAALLLTGLLSGCSVLAVADAAVTVTATTVDIGAKAVGAAVDITSAEHQGGDAQQFARHAPLCATDRTTGVTLCHAIGQYGNTYRFGQLGMAHAGQASGPCMTGA